MRILHLRLENWKNFRKVDIPLRRRAFVVGPNASGKSNLLDAIRFLQDLAAVSGGLQKAVLSRGGVSKIRCLAARMHSDIAFQIELGLEAESPQWRYRIVFNQDNLRRPIIREEVVCRDGAQLLARPDEQDSVDPERLTQTYLEQVNTNRGFREIAEFLGTVKYLHIVPQLIRDTERYLGRSKDPFGSDFLEQVARTSNRTRDARLKRIGEALKVAVPQLSEIELFRDERGTPHMRGKYEHWRPRGAWQGEDQFSDGTLRLLGLLWAVLDGTGPLLLEEPELSLHPAVVKYIPQMLWRAARKSGRQILLSTHSVELLADPGIAADEVLMLSPTRNGTEVMVAATQRDVAELLKAGISISDIVMPRIAPKNPQQLSLFETV